MRNKNTLKAFEDVSILFQYLYMDENNRIVVNNGLCDLQIRMDQDCHVFCKINQNDLRYDDAMSIANTLAMIEQLKMAKPVQYPEHFDNRWAEIKEITKMNLALNFNRR